jgi:hypothetical protein
MTPANWTIKTDANGTSVFFTLKKETLLTWKDWSEPARSYIESSADGINIEELFESYVEKISKFHRWLRSQVRTGYNDELGGFYSAKRAYSRTHTQSSWNIWISQVAIPGGHDPYEYIEALLTQNQLEEVLSLPFRSKVQVDRIIALADEYTACNTDLRENIYKLFGVAT